MIGLLRILVRALLGVLVGAGIIAALLGRRRPGKADPVPIPIPEQTKAAPAVRGRGVVLALVCLLLEGGLILAVFGGSDMLSLRAMRPPATDPAGGSVAALPPAQIDAGRALDGQAGTPPGSGAKAERGPQGGPMPAGTFDPRMPTFDTVRVESNGDVVVAGRASPDASVELLIDGKPLAQVVADADGAFAIVPPALPAGNSEIGLRATDAQGRVRRSPVSVAVMVSSSRDATPLVALTSPDKPTVVLSQPDLPPMAGRTIPDAAPGRQAALGLGPAGQQDPGRGNSIQDRSSDGLASGTAGASKGIAAEGAVGTDRSGTSGPGPLADKALPGSTAPAVASKEAFAAATKIVSVDAQDGGRLFVTGRSATGSLIRLYLNDTLIAPATVGRDGTVTFTIGRGVKPGAYKVRLDQVDAVSGKVRNRVEVPFSVPDTERIVGTEHLAGSQEVGPQAKPDGSQSRAPTSDTAQQSDRTNNLAGSPQASGTGTPAARGSSEATKDPSTANSSAVFVPEVKTARIERGDSLWEISRRTYGAGDRYTVIYDANQDQIRNPDLIYPGQIFVLPGEDATEDKRG